MPDRRRTVQSAKPHANRRSVVLPPTPRKRKAVPKPIMDDCEECGGTGAVQLHCDGCAAPLTEANIDPAYGGCKTCADKDRKDWENSKKEETP